MKSTDTAHERDIEFGVLPMSDVINTRKSKFLVKYGLSYNILCLLSKLCSAAV